MKEGSLVECVEDLSKFPEPENYKVLPKVGDIFLVRGFYTYRQPNDFIYLSEVDNFKADHHGTPIEIPYLTRWFRELQPPMDLSELLEQPEIMELTPDL